MTHTPPPDRTPGPRPGPAAVHPAASAAVVGASGYAGAELLRLMGTHPVLEVVVATAASNAGVPAAQLYPSLTAAYPDLVLAAYTPEAVAGVDVVFLSLPHGESQRLVPELMGRVGHIVDLGADFRLPSDVYARWYGAGHGAPDLLESFAFGIPELFPDAVAATDHVASPGCYPTTAALALAPLIAAGLVEPDGIVVDAVSGISGRGRGLSAPSLYAEADGDVTAYGLLEHRHTGEIEYALDRVARRAPGGSVAGEPRPPQVLFTPHLVPMVRGIFATCHARPAVDGLSSAGLLDHYRRFYEGCRFVSVLDDPPHSKATSGSNSCHLTVRADPRTGGILALAALDNLGKGAAGQAVQNANLLLGLDEATGLGALGIWP